MDNGVYFGSIVVREGVGQTRPKSKTEHLGQSLNYNHRIFVGTLSINVVSLTVYYV